MYEEIGGHSLHEEYVVLFSAILYTLVLIMWGSFYGSIEWSSMVFLHLIMLFSLAGFYRLCLSGGSLGSEGGRPFKRFSTPAYPLHVIFIICVLVFVSTVVSQDWRVAGLSLFHFLSYVALFLVIASFFGGSGTRYLQSLKIFSIATVCVSLVAIYAYYDRISVPAALPLGHHNYLGSFLLLTLPFTVAAVLLLQSVSWRVLGAVASGLNLYTLSITRSLGAFIGFLTMLLLLILLRIIRNSSEKAKVYLLATVAIVLIAMPFLLGFLYVKPLYERTIQESRVPEAVQTEYNVMDPIDEPDYAEDFNVTISGTRSFGYNLTRLAHALSGGLDNSIIRRPYYWIGAFHGFRNDPFFGRGLGSVPMRFAEDRVELPGLSARGQILSQVHSTYFQILYEQGIFGIVTVLLVLHWVVFHGLGSISGETDRGRRLVRVCVFVSLVSYSVVCSTNYELDVPAISITLVIIMGLLYGLELARVPAAPMVGQSKPRRFLRPFVAGVIACSVVMYAMTDSAHYFYNRGMSKFLQTGKLASSEEDFSEAAKIDPYLGFYQFQYAHASACALGDHRDDGEDPRERIESIEANYAAAVSRLPHVVGYHEQYGCFLLQQGDFEGATGQFRQALRLNYYSPSVHFYLGESLRKTGKIQASRHEYAISFLLEARIMVDHLDWPDHGAAVRDRFMQLLERAEATPVDQGLGDPIVAYTESYNKDAAVSRSVFLFRRLAPPNALIPILLDQRHSEKIDFLGLGYLVGMGDLEAFEFDRI
jgi:hypothetical protein